MKKKIVLALAVVAAVLVLAVAVLHFVIDADSFRGFIETRAEDVLDRDVRLGGIGLSIVPVFGLEVDDVAVAARSGEGEGDLLSLRSLRIGARLVPLLQRRLEVTSIVIVEPTVNLVRDAEGDWNFDLGAGQSVEREPAAERDAGPEVTIDTVRVTGGRFSFRDASRSSAQPLEVDLAELDLEISGFGGDAFRVVMDGGKLDVTDSAIGPHPLHLEIGAVVLAVHGGGQSVAVERVELVVGRTPVALTGTIEAQADGWRIDIDLEPTSIAAADVTSLLATASGDLGLSISGDRPIELEAGVHGVLAENRLPRIEATARLNDITMDADTLTRPVTGLSAAATLRSTAVAVEGLRGRVGDTDFSGVLEFTLRDRPLLEFTLESQRADLGELLGLVGGGEDIEADQAVPPDPDSFLIKGIADGTLQVAEGSWLNLRFRDLEARMRLEDGVATLDPVSMELYDGRFSGRLASDLSRAPQSFEFSGEAQNIDMDSFVADQIGTSGLLMGRLTGRVAGQGTGTDLATVVRALEGEGVARIVEGQVGRLDVLRSVGQVAGVLGQRTLANLASESVTGATKFSRLAGDFRIGGGTLTLDSVLLESAAFDLTGAGAVDLLSSVMNGTFQIRFSPEVSAWMSQESSRAAELFWDSGSNRVVLPLGLSGPLDGAGASVDWNAAVEDVARRTIEREVSDMLGNLISRSGDDKPAAGAASTPGAPAVAPTPARRAGAPSGSFTLEVTSTRWGGPFLAQDFKIRCRVTGTGVERAVMTAVDAGGREVQKETIDLAGRLEKAGEASFEVRVDGKRLLLVDSPVTVTVVATGTGGETAAVELEIED